MSERDETAVAERERPAVIWDQDRLRRFTFADPALARDIVTLFLRELDVQLVSLVTAATPAQWQIAAHTLKGSAATIGALALSAAASDAQRLVERRDGTYRWAAGAGSVTGARGQIEKAATDLRTALQAAGYTALAEPSSRP